MTKFKYLEMTAKKLHSQKIKSRLNFENALNMKFRILIFFSYNLENFCFIWVEIGSNVFREEYGLMVFNLSHLNSCSLCTHIDLYGI